MLFRSGFGLSYTEFETKDAELEDGAASVTVKNTGKRAGDTVVQVYAACESPFAPRNPRLCGFRRVTLEAGEEKKIRVALDPLTWTVVDENGDRQPVQKGILYIGLNQPDPRSVTLTGMKPLELKKN